MATDEITKKLVAEHRRFLAFLKKRVGSEDVAEEILQAAFVKAVERGAALEHEEKAVAWFYRLLQNALADHFRRAGAESRRRERKGRELTRTDERALERTVCRCVSELVPLLKPDYADLLRRAEIDGAPIAQVAREQGITANNAAVKLHRARKALKREVERVCGTCTEHGCSDCSCKEA
jgi:RNA polymerase sigma-70 factor (ECF subfamily)